MGPNAHERRATYVYVISGGPLRIKIGISRNVGRRRSTLQVSTPDRLIVRYRLKPETKRALEVEDAAMQLLARWRVSGEWFRCTEGLAIIAVEAAALNCERRVGFIDRYAEYEATVDLEDKAERLLAGRRHLTPAKRATLEAQRESAREAERHCHQSLKDDFPDLFPRADEFTAWQQGRGR